MKKIKYYILLIILCLTPTIIKANEYKVKDYEISIDISENRIYRYEESINIIFIDFNTYVTKEIDATAKNLTLNTNYLTETSDTKIIKINSGSSSNSTYTYRYDITERDYNENIYEIKIANSFNSTLNDISFYITIAEDFNKNNLKFYLNDIELKDIDYIIESGVIKGNIKELKENDILTVKIDFETVYVDTTTSIATIIPIILTIISGIMWYIFGRDVKYKPIKSYELPKNMSPLEAGLLINGKAKEKDAISLLLHLANKGYIKIIENSNNNYTIKRIKDYDGKKYPESLFIKSLFKKNISISLTDYISIVSERKNNNQKIELEKNIENNELNKRFQKAKNIVLPVVNDIEEKDKYFEKSSERKKAYLMIIIGLILLILTSLPFIEINKLYLLPLSVIFSIITLYLLLSFIESNEIQLSKKNIIILILAAIAILIIMLVPAFRRNKVYLVTFAVCSICIAIILFFYKFMPKRTIYGAKQYAKLEGFKEFIVVNNTDDFKIINSKDENYFYDILPYCYSLNLKDEVITIMKDLKLKEPTWFKLKDDFTIQKLSNSLDRLEKVLTEKSED